MQEEHVTVYMVIVSRIEETVEVEGWDVSEVSAVEVFLDRSSDFEDMVSVD